MKRKQRIWLTALLVTALLALLIFVWQFPNFREQMNRTDRGNAPAQTELQQPQGNGDHEPERDSEQTGETGSEQVGTEENSEPSHSEESLASEDTTQPTQELTEDRVTKPSASDEPATEPSEESTTRPDNDPQARIDELIAMVYALRDEYTARLYAIESTAIAQYKALPPEEQTEEKKRQIAMDCVDQAYALENECDGRISDICYELGVLLVKSGGNMNLVNEIRYVYASEKTAVKNELTERYAALLG